MLQDRKMKNLFYILVAVAAVLILPTYSMSLKNIESELETFELLLKRDNLIDKVYNIQDLLDKYVASVVNGTPLPEELVALGADTNPQDFILKVILMAASNLTKKRDLLTVAKVI